MSSPAVRVSYACAVVAAVFSAAAGEAFPSIPATRPDDAGSAGISGAVLWSAMAGCLGPDSTGPAAVCLKTKALTGLDRALAQTTVPIANGVSLTGRAGRYLRVDRRAADADRAALHAAEDPDHKNALLDRLIADQLDALVSTRAIVLQDVPIGPEGRGNKKQQRSMRLMAMLVGMLAVTVLAPMAFGFVALLTGKALLVGKIALATTGLLAFRKLF